MNRRGDAEVTVGAATPEFDIERSQSLTIADCCKSSRLYSLMRNPGNNRTVRSIRRPRLRCQQEQDQERLE